MPYTKLRYKVAGGVALITLVEPPANTYSYETMRELDDAVLAARMDSSVHEFKYAFCLHANETLCRLEQTPKLVIAALNGHTAVQSGPEAGFGEGLAREGI